MVILAVIVLGVGVWYISRGPSQNQVAPPPAATQQPAQQPAPAPETQPVSQPEPAQPAAAEPTAAPEETPAPPETKQESTKEETSAEAQARAAEELRAAAARRREQVAAATRQGDLYYQNGQYDSAIREYEKGLRADPSSVLLRQKIDRAKRAKATEEALQ